MQVIAGKGVGAAPSATSSYLTAARQIAVTIVLYDVYRYALQENQALPCSKSLP
jgi:hypothetical protein